VRIVRTPIPSGLRTEEVPCIPAALRQGEVTAIIMWKLEARLNTELARFSPPSSTQDRRQKVSYTPTPLRGKGRPSISLCPCRATKIRARWRVTRKRLFPRPNRRLPRTALEIESGRSALAAANW
jgi:hypothetical protein